MTKFLKVRCEGNKQLVEVMDWLDAQGIHYENLPSRGQVPVQLPLNIEPQDTIPVARPSRRKIRRRKITGQSTESVVLASLSKASTKGMTYKALEYEFRKAGYNPNSVLAAVSRLAKAGKVTRDKLNGAAGIVRLP